MYQRVIKIKVHQQINHLMNQSVDEWFLETEAVHTALRTYSKIRYQDQEGYPIEVKWQMDPSNTFQIVEIIQPAYTLRFNPQVETVAAYQTPQGLWELNIKTIDMAIEELDGLKSLHINYQISLNDQILGLYNYHLTAS